MTVAEITETMILRSGGNLHDINHFLKVYAYAKTIGEREGLPAPRQRALEAAAILHDIACPLCREKYGNTNGKKQEIEGMPLVRAFFQGTDMDPETLERVVYLVGHHHTLTGIDGPDYQILVEADYLVNAEESGYDAANRENALKTVFRTETGKRLLRALYKKEDMA